MNKLLSLFLISLILLSCNNSNKTETINQDSKANQISKIGRHNYAVVWDWSTDDKELVTVHAATFTKELLNLWENNDIENVYLNPEVELNDKLPFPSISFFVKAHSIEAARSILNELTIVKKEIADYKLYPVGILWLEGNKKSLAIHTDYKSFVTVWDKKYQTPDAELTKAQNDIIINLWNNGTIENVYFDVEGVTNQSEKTDFVFFVKARNQDEAESICKTLPFYKEKIASYKIFNAGTFWLGINNKKTLN